MEEEVWTLDYEGEGEKAVALERAMNAFMPKLEADKRIQRMDVLFLRSPNTLRMRVEIVSTGDPFKPPWPGTFADTQIGLPKLFRSQPELSIART
jgi:hypothetical protein